MRTTQIPYCDATWDLTIGCRKRSPGCANCWATRTVHRLARRGVRGYCGQEEPVNGLPPYLLQISLDGENWEPTPYVNQLWHNVGRPLQWKMPQFILVNSKSDLFDERVRFEFIGAAFDVMAQAKQHRYMILTKEPGRLGEFIAWYSTHGRRRMGAAWPDDFPHVILMTSIEDAEHLHRWDTLAAIPAVLRGISFEPLLEPVTYALRARLRTDREIFWDVPPDWIIVGCEKLLGGSVGRWSPHPHCMSEEFVSDVYRLLDICHAADPPIRVWVKHVPNWPPGGNGRLRVTDEVQRFPEACRIQQHPPWSP